MVVIKYAKPSIELHEIIDLLRENSFAFRQEENKSLSALVLVQDTTEIVGYKRVKAYVEKLVSETHQWWYCQCEE